MFNARSRPVNLVLRNGAVFRGASFGAHQTVLGEVVFATGMVGYGESLTDPSYAGQILVLTYPLVGNYGVPATGDTNEQVLPAFGESSRIHAAGLVVQDVSVFYYHWGAGQSLATWLHEARVPGVSGIDTRAVATCLRTGGVMPGALVPATVPVSAVLRRLRQRRSFPTQPIRAVSCTTAIQYPFPGRARKRILLVDCGVKYSILRSVLRRGYAVTRVPWNAPIATLASDYDGIIVSNGPGDPRNARTTIRELHTLLKKTIPILGICLGNQLLALAAGASTYKMKFGHRSQNQPCVDQQTSRSFLTTQNHGYAIRPGTLPRAWEEWFTNANDGTTEGIRHREKPFLAVQFHPEAHPGPHDTEWVFDTFFQML